MTDPVAWYASCEHFTGCAIDADMLRRKFLLHGCQVVPEPLHLGEEVT